MVAQRKNRQKQAAPPSAAPAWEPMSDPLHPMHQELLRRFAAPTQGDDRWSRPVRSAVIFYSGLGAWGLVAAAGYAAYALI